MNAKTNIERVREWCRRSLAGEIPCCLMVRKAIERWQADLDRPDLYFDEKAFNRFVRFAREFKHYKGPAAGQRFEPEDWQLFIMANVIGLKRKETGLRKYTYADIYVPRKNGKTYLAAIFAAYFLLKDGEAGPEVYTAAVDQAQARLCYDASAELIRRSIFAVDTKPYQWGMKSPGNAGVFKPLSKDTKNKDGLNIHAAICDERHAWPTTEIYDVIKTGMGARSQPMLLSISTAGTDTSNPYFADIEVYKDILRGIKSKDNHFLMLFTPDDGDRWDDPETWAKVNPNLGVSLSVDYMRAECDEAKLRGGTYQVAFQTKNLNLWVNAPDVWISDEDVKENAAPFDLSRLSGEDCYVGLDLASKSDISAVCLFFPKFKVARFLFDRHPGQGPRRGLVRGLPAGRARALQGPLRGLRPMGDVEHRPEAPEVRGSPHGLPAEHPLYERPDEVGGDGGPPAQPEPPGQSGDQVDVPERGRLHRPEREREAGQVPLQEQDRRRGRAG